MWRWRRRPSSARCRPGVLTFTFKQLIESSSGLTTLVTSSTVNNGTSNNKNSSRNIDVDGCVARGAFFLGVYLPVRNSRLSFFPVVAASAQAVQDLQQVSYGLHLTSFDIFHLICALLAALKQQQQVLSVARHLEQLAAGK